MGGEVAMATHAGRVGQRDEGRLPPPVIAMTGGARWDRFGLLESGVRGGCVAAIAESVGIA